MVGNRKSGITFESVVRGALVLCMVAGFWYVRAKTGDELPEEWQPAYVAVLFLVVIPSYLLWERHRSRAFRQAAARLGMTAGADGQVIRLPFSALRHGPSPSNMVLGQRGEQEVVLFEFRTGTRRSRQTHTAVAYRFPKQNLSEFVLRPETGLGFITKLVGMKDIDFSAIPEFSRNYLLTGRDETKIRTVFNQSLLEFFNWETGWTVEGHDDWLLVYRRGVREKPDRLSQFLLESGRVADVFAGLRSDDAPPGVPADDDDDDAMHPVTDRPGEGTGRAYEDSFLGRLASRYGIAIVFTAAIAVTTWREMRDVLPGNLIAVFVVAWTILAGVGIFAVSGSLFRAPTADNDSQ